MRVSEERLQAEADAEAEEDVEVDVGLSDPVATVSGALFLLSPKASEGFPTLPFPDPCDWDWD